MSMKTQTPTAVEPIFAVDEAYARARQAEVRRMFNRVLANWASDVLWLRKHEALQPGWRRGTVDDALADAA